MRLLSGDKKNIAVNLFSKLGWELGLYYASYDDFHPDILTRDVYLAELHCRGRERVFELEDSQSVMDRLLTAGLCGNTIGQDIQTLTYHSSTSNMAFHLKDVCSSNFTWLLNMMLT